MRIAAVAALLLAVGIPLARASSTAPIVTSISLHADWNWGHSTVTVHGVNFSHVEAVYFGTVKGLRVSVVSSTELLVLSPQHSNGLVHVHVQTPQGLSGSPTVAAFTFLEPSMNSGINHGWSANTEISIDKTFEAKAHALESVSIAPASKTWTLAMGQSAAKRAQAWLGVPYTFSGGSRTSPTYGSCDMANGSWGAEYDCQVWGFDCSGLTTYGWGPYASLVPYTGWQVSYAGKFHPGQTQLEPGDLLFYAGDDGGSGIGHVAMYVGAGVVVQAYESGHPIMDSKLSDMTALAGHYFGATRPLSTGQQGSSPTVTSISAHSAPTGGGGELTITGSGFSEVTSVEFGTHMGYSYKVVSSHTIVATIPAYAAGTVNVRVANAWGLSAEHSADLFTFVAAPTITSLSPSSGTSAGGTLVTIHGENFTGVTAVNFGTPAGTSVHVLNSTTLTAVTPAHAAINVAVVVYSKYGHSSTAHTFLYVAPPPPTTSAPPPPTTSASPPPTTSPPPSSDAPPAPISTAISTSPTAA